MPDGTISDGTAFKGALAGIRVVDFGQMVSAPYCAKLFSDFGADVIKVELPEGQWHSLSGNSIGFFSSSVIH